MATNDVCSAVGAYLADVGLAQWSALGDYRDDPSLPAVLLADADSPDHAVVLTVTDRNRGLGLWDVRTTWRAVGVNGAPVERLADACADHWAIEFALSAGTWVGGTRTVMPSVTLPGGLIVRSVSVVSRGTVELTSPAKHKGTRFVRTDVYRMAITD